MENRKLDYKKEFKDLYMPKSKPSLIEVPAMNFIMVYGKGNPNEEGGEYYYFIDKSIFIKEFWNDSKISLITRPRRFGKTLNMSMLKYFFDNKEDNKALFKNLQIYNDEEMMKHQGKYPVIYLSFRGCGASTAEETILSIKEVEQTL